MPPSKAASVGLNPSWPHFGCIVAVGLGLFAGLARYILSDWTDPTHCSSLLNRGSWLDSAQQTWQPNGCMLHSYTVKEGSSCLAGREVVFVGDSVTRKLFFQLAHVLDPALPTVPSDADGKHADHKLRAKSGVQVTFYWDPYLNGSYIQNALSLKRLDGPSSPALLVLGSGLWYLRYPASGGIPAWEAKMERIFTSLSRRLKIADHAVVLPVEQVISSKLSPARAATIHPSDIEAMNSDLYHRINPPTHSRRPTSSNNQVSLPLVFNQMLLPSLTEDGLHYSDTLVKTQANILLNLRCNDQLAKRFPFDKTCCNRYPIPSFLQLFILGCIILWGPYTLYVSYFLGSRTGPLERELPSFIISSSVALLYAADRTGFWLKEQKEYNPLTFAFLCLGSLLVGLLTVKRVDKDPGFMSRDQTDEWKGWMQVAILIYHYLGASKISGIYNPVRVLVASYLFMTGYGHTMFYLRKADFGFLRIAQVMVRLNLLTIILAYTMNTDYISYYFSPLVSMWFLIIYGTMAIGRQLNDHTPLLLGKISLSAALVTWVMHAKWPLEALFDLLARVCRIHWSSGEWAFRVNLDLWIVYVGMLTAVAVAKTRDYRLADHQYWPVAVKCAIALSGSILVWFFAFELYQESKFTYNLWHPYISFLPVVAFTVLRNANPIMRSASSRAFSFIGKCSLETFIVQFHFWLAGDSKGVLLVLPGTKWRSINFVLTTIMFIYISDRLAYATGEITSWICAKASDALPLPVTVPMGGNSSAVHSGSDADGTQEVSIPLISHFLDHHLKDANGNPLPPEPDTPVRPRRWVDRLAEQAPASSDLQKMWYTEGQWRFGVKARLALAICGLWLLNWLWPDS